MVLDKRPREEHDESVKIEVNIASRRMESPRGRLAHQLKQLNFYKKHY